MAKTVNRGPLWSLGSLMGNVTPMVTGSTTPAAVIEPGDGPSLLYQASAIPDVRAVSETKDNGRFPAFLNNADIVLTDVIPSTAATAAIAALANTTSGTAMTLVTIAPGAGASDVTSMNPVMPVVRGDTGAIVTAFGIDVGFATGTIVAGSGTVTVTDSTKFYVGQWIVIGGAGNSAKTLSLITQVTALASATTLTISPKSVGTLTRAPISSANLYTTTNSGFNVGATATGAWPYANGGSTRIFNPAEGVSRVISITGSSGGAGGAFKIAGYDIYGYPMNETITAASGAATTNGVKAWKYVASVTPQFSDAHNYSVGTADIFGINLRSDKFEYLSIADDGTFITASTGWTQALQPQNGPSTATTADVRGTYAVQTATDAGDRLFIAMAVPLYNLINATPVDATPLFGLAQF